ncbi:DNA repair ATPase [Pseudomonas aeruginosa]
MLLTCNLINRQLQNPLFGHGYARLEDGRMVIFAAEGEEPTRIHPMQVWQTPFCTEEYAARQPARSGFSGRIGNAELVRGVSTSTTCAGRSRTPAVSIQRYSLLCQNTQRLFDVYHWLGSDQLDGLAPLLREVAATAELVLDEVREGRKYPPPVGARRWSTRRSGTRRSSPACCPTAGTGCSSSSTGSAASPPSVGCC